MTEQAILIDDRERRSGLAEALNRKSGSPCKVTRLDVGDIWIGESYVVERKEVRDFVASLVEGRLHCQLDGLIKSPRKPVIILEGELKHENLGGISGWSLRQAILSVTLEWGIALLRSRDVDDTAAWLLALAGYGGEPEALALDFRPRRTRATVGAPAGTRHRPVRSPEAIPLAALGAVPGLGKSRARALLDHFGSLKAMLKADERTLAEVKGIGPALAREIRKKMGV